jgi:hypothetical protein
MFESSGVYYPNSYNKNIVFKTNKTIVEFEAESEIGTQF